MIQTTFVGGRNPFIKRSVLTLPKVTGTIRSAQQAAESRSTILGYIREHPGCLLSQIVNGTKFCVVTVTKYRALLLEEGLIVQSKSEKNGSHKGHKHWALQ